MAEIQEPSAEELSEIKRFIEEAEEIDVASDDIRQIVERHWPWLLEKLPPRMLTCRSGRPRP
jgi:hypothetical protein